MGGVAEVTVAADVEAKRGCGGREHLSTPPQKASSHGPRRVAITQAESLHKRAHQWRERGARGERLPAAPVAPPFLPKASGQGAAPPNTAGQACARRHRAPFLQRSAHGVARGPAARAPSNASRAAPGRQRRRARHRGTGQRRGRGAAAPRSRRGQLAPRPFPPRQRQDRGPLYTLNKQGTTAWESPEPVSGQRVGHPAA